jgi:Papain family cysteine protease
MIMFGPCFLRICASALVLVALHALGQSPKHVHGLPLPNDTAYVQSLLEYAFTIPKGETLPASMDIREYFAQPGDQGPYASCTAWAIGYGIMTYDRNRAKGIKPDQSKAPAPRDVLSPGYLFTMVKRYAEPDTSQDPCIFGVATQATFTIASRWGNVPASVYGYAGALQDCRDSVHLNVMDSALFRKLRTPVKLYHPCPGCPDYHEGPFYPLQWQYHLSLGEPILVGIYTDDTFFERGDSAYKAGSTHFVWDRPVTGDGGSHSIVCCGYNTADSTFLFYNSFGTEWGNNGYCWINYRTLYKQCTEAYVFNGGYDQEIKPRKALLIAPATKSDTTASGKLGEGHFFQLGGLNVALAEHDQKSETSLVRLVDPASGKVIKALNLHDEVPRSVVINDRLWTFHFTEPTWFSTLFGDHVHLSVEVDAEEDEAMGERMKQHIERFRQR